MKISLSLVHDVVLFLGHGAAHQVAAAIGIAGQIAHDLHDLFLIDHAAVGDVEDGLQQRRARSCTLGGVVLALDVAGDGLHRPGPVERDGGDDILEVLGLHVASGTAACPPDSSWNTPSRVALGDHLVDAGVVQGDVLRCRTARPRLGAHHARCVVHDDVERAQAEKVHLQQAQRLQRGHGELGGDHLVVGLQGHVVDHRLAGDEHAGRVGGGVAGHALELVRRVDQLAHAARRPRRCARSSAESDRARSSVMSSSKGTSLAIWSDLLIGHAHHPAHVADDAAGGHGAEGDDLRHVVLRRSCART